LLQASVNSRSTEDRSGRSRPCEAAIGTVSGEEVLSV
jgi:hypothetical protein